MNYILRVYLFMQTSIKNCIVLKDYVHLENIFFYNKQTNKYDIKITLFQIKSSDQFLSIILLFLKGFQLTINVL